MGIRGDSVLVPGCPFFSFAAEVVNRDRAAKGPGVRASPRRQRHRGRTGGEGKEPNRAAGGVGREWEPDKSRTSVQATSTRGWRQRVRETLRGLPSVNG